MTIDATVLATLIALQEVAAPSAQAGVELSSVNIEEGLSEVQTKFIQDKSQTRTVLGGRRAGKSVAFRRALLKAAAMFPGKLVLYISLTRQLAKKNIWGELKRDCQALGIPYNANESELSLTVVGGGTIFLGGAADSSDIERYRGLAYVLVIIDECGSQNPGLLRTLVLDVLGPALMDFGGQLVLGGTPGFQLDGYWFEMSGPLRRSSHPHYHWTIYDNPLFRGRADEELLRKREENSWTEQSVTYRREYLGEWIQDASVLVYPYDAHKNLVLAVPTVSELGYRLHPKDWSYRLGVDVGVVDATALSLVAAHRALRQTLVLHHEQHVGLKTGEVGDRIHDVREMAANTFPNADSIKVKLDSGGMGKVHAIELTPRFGVLLEPAEKTEKASAIRVFRDRLMVGGVQLLDGACNELISEWAKLGWDSKREQHDPNGADHGSDATLYADRDLMHWRWDPAANAPAPRYGTPEWHEQQEQLAIERDERQAMGGGRASWDR